jgi:hypothetical protein
MLLAPGKTGGLDDIDLTTPAGVELRPVLTIQYYYKAGLFIHPPGVGTKRHFNHGFHHREYKVMNTCGFRPRLLILSPDRASYNLSNIINR